MGDCVTASILPTHFPTRSIRKLGFNSRTRSLRIEEITTRNSSGGGGVTARFRNGDSQLIIGGSKSNKSEINLAAKPTITSTNATRRNPSSFGSEEFDFYSELGLKQKEKRQNLFETVQSSEEEEDPEYLATRNDHTSICDNVGELNDEDLVKMEGPDSDAQGSKLAESKKKQNVCPDVRSGRRKFIRRSNIIAKQVISIQSALSLGFVSQLWVDTTSWVVVIVEVRPNLLSGEVERFLLDDVGKVGDVLLIEDEGVMYNEFKLGGLETLVGYNVVTPGQQNIGKVRGYTFNINSGAIESLELDSFGISIIPSSLVSTYALFVEDVLEVFSDRVVVHEAAASRIQRLTKGFWDAQNMGNSMDERREYADLERQPVSNDNGRERGRSSASRKFRRKVRQTKDEWELPMDYL